MAENQNNQNKGKQQKGPACPACKQLLPPGVTECAWCGKHWFCREHERWLRVEQPTCPTCDKDTELRRAEEEAKLERDKTFVRCKSCNLLYEAKSGGCPHCTIECVKCKRRYLATEAKCTFCPKDETEGGRYELEAIPTEGKNEWFVNLTIYYEPLGKIRRAVAGKVDAFDEGVKTVTVSAKGKTIKLPFRRQDRSVRFSVQEVTVSAGGSSRTFNPDVHTSPIVLTGKPVRRISAPVAPDPILGFWENFKRGLRGS